MTIRLSTLLPTRIKDPLSRSGFPFPACLHRLRGVRLAAVAFDSDRIFEMSRICAELDVHVVALLVLCSPIVLFNEWWLGVPLVLPQGLLLTRAVDIRKSGGQMWTYLGANELLILATVALLLGLQIVIRGTAR